MITLIITLIALLVLVAAVALTVLAGGAGIILVFGDLIIGIAIVYMIVKLIRRKRK